MKKIINDVEYDIRPGADLSSANLVRANLYEANLARANLYGADLARANLFRGESLQGESYLG